MNRQLLPTEIQQRQVRDGHSPTYAWVKEPATNHRQYTGRPTTRKRKQRRDWKHDALVLGCLFVVALVCVMSI